MATAAFDAPKPRWHFRRYSCTVEPGAGDGGGADGDDSDYHLPDDSQVNSDHIILETECPSSDDLHFTPGVQGSQVGASTPAFHPQFKHSALPPRFFPPMSRPAYFTRPYSDAGVIQLPRAMPTFSQHLYDSDQDYGQPLHLGTGLNLNSHCFSQD